MEAVNDSMGLDEGTKSSLKLPNSNNTCNSEEEYPLKLPNSIDKINHRLNDGSVNSGEEISQNLYEKKIALLCQENENNQAKTKCNSCVSFSRDEEEDLLMKSTDNHNKDEPLDDFQKPNVRNLFDSESDSD